MGLLGMFAAFNFFYVVNQYASFTPLRFDWAKKGSVLVVGARLRTAGMDMRQLGL